jgi:hypothetical protein
MGKQHNKLELQSVLEREIRFNAALLLELILMRVFQCSTERAQAGKC